MTFLAFLTWSFTSLMWGFAFLASLCFPDVIVEKNRMSLLVTLLLDRQRAHNKSIIHVINRKSEFLKNMPTSSVFNDLVSPYDLYGRYDKVESENPDKKPIDIMYDTCCLVNFEVNIFYGSKIFLFINIIFNRYNAT
jgi:hypothetical protein